MGPSEGNAHDPELHQGEPGNRSGRGHPARSPPAYDDDLRARQIGHDARFGQFDNRLVGKLHGCDKSHTAYNEAVARSHRDQNRVA